MKISGKSIGLKHEPFIIAEMSGNHNGSLERALKIVEEAAICGADAIKLQTYTEETLTIDVDREEFFISDKNSLWYGQSLHNLYKQAHTPWEWHKDIFAHAKKNNLICFSSPFDDSAVELLESLNTPAYKIASPEIVDHGLIEKVANQKKPIIISTGMASFDEISEAVEICIAAGNNQIALLQCTSSYPADAKNSNLRTIPDLRKIFKCEVGLSDHTMGIGAALSSIALGATIIEKHFTLSRDDKGVDSEFSLDPLELRNLVKESKKSHAALGEIKYGTYEAEKGALIFRRSLYVIKDIVKGEKFSKENIKSIRPGLGLHTRYLPKLIGKKAKTDLKKGTPVSLDMI